MIPKLQLKYYRQLRDVQAIRWPAQADYAPLRKLPHYIDLRDWMPPVVDQGLSNTCSAATFASACEYLIKRHTGQHIPISQLFIYFNGRFMDQGTYSFDDDGASRRNVVKGMRRFGICKEELWPFKKRLLNRKPPDNVYDEAKRTTVTSHRIPLDIAAIRKYLAKEFPAMVGIKIQDGVYNKASVNGGYLSIPNPYDMDVVHTTTHAVLIVGYDDKNRHFIVRNSWGSHWGNHGYFYMPYKYLLDERLANYEDGAWVVTHIAQPANHAPVERQLGVARHHHHHHHSRRY